MTARVVLALMFLGTVGTASAESETARLRVSDVFVLVNPCTAEPLLIERDAQTFTRLMIDGNGDTHFQFNGRWQYYAVGPSGIEYVGTETGNWKIRGANETYVSHGHLIAKGPAPDLHIFTYRRTRVTPDGTIVLDVEDQRLECRG